MPKFFGKNRRSGNNRPRQRATPSFVNSRNARDSCDAEFFLVAKSAPPVGHQRKSFADLRRVTSDDVKEKFGQARHSARSAGTASVSAVTDQIVDHSRTAVASFPLRVRR